MRTYDVYYGQEHHAIVRIHDDGQKTWEFTSEWKDFRVQDVKTGIEQALDIWCNHDEFTFQKIYTIRRRDRIE